MSTDSVLITWVQILDLLYLGELEKLTSLCPFPHITREVVGVPTVDQQDPGASLQHQDEDSIPSQAQWVKGSGIAAAAACGETAQLRSDPWPGNSMCSQMAKREKKKKKEFLLWLSG